MMKAFVVLMGLLIPCSGQSAGKLPPSIEPVSDEELEFVFSANQETVSNLQCKVSGIPEPDVEWFKGSDPVDPKYYKKGKDNSLEFLRHERLSKLVYSIEQSGFIHCVATNAHASVRSRSYHAMFSLLQPLRSNSRTRVVDQYSSVVLEADDASSLLYPIGQLSWKNVDLDEVISTTEKSRIIDLDGNLHFLSIRLGDANVYRFCPTNDLGSSCGVTYDVTVIARDTKPAPELNMVYPDPNNPRSREPLVVVQGERVELMCVFSGVSVNGELPDVSWPDLPPGLSPTDFNRRVVIENVMNQIHERSYQCMGRLDALTRTFTYNVVVKVRPEWETDSSKLASANVTVGGGHNFTCKTYAIPAATVVWTINGRPFADYVPRPGEVQPRIGSKGDYLEFPSGIGQSQLLSVSCNASNDFGYIFSSAYLNVVQKTNLQRSPQNSRIVMELGQETRFSCEATPDPIFNITFSWFKGNSKVLATPNTLIIKGEKCTIGKPCNTTLQIKTTLHSLNDDFNGDYRCIARADGGQSVENKWTLEVQGIPEPKPDTARAGIPFWVFIIIGVAVLIIVIVVVICCCCMRSKGQDYPLDVLERKAGHDPAQELLDTGFHDYERPPAYEDAPANHIDLDDDEKPLDSDTDSMGEYGDIDTGKFNEDGSFIGQYGSDRKKRGRQAPGTADSQV